MHLDEITSHRRTLNPDSQLGARNVFSQGLDGGDGPLRESFPSDRSSNSDGSVFSEVQQLPRSPRRPDYLAKVSYAQVTNVGELVQHQLRSPSPSIRQPRTSRSRRRHCIGFASFSSSPTSSPPLPTPRARYAHRRTNSRTTPLSSRRSDPTSESRHSRLGVFSIRSDGKKGRRLRAD